MQKNETGLLSHTIYNKKKKNLKWIKNLNVTPETMKLLEQNIGSMLFDINLSNIFIPVSSSKENKSNNKQMVLHQTKKLLHSEENQRQN